MGKQEISKMLGVFFLASAYNLSKTHFFSKESFVNSEGLATAKDYQNFWNSIASSGIISAKKSKELGSVARTRGAKPLWIEVQNAFNDTCRELFIEGFEHFMRITMDDDKMHSATSKVDTHGLKKSRHVRDNRNGFIAHTICYTGIGMPVGIEWERSSDDSTSTAAERLLRAQLAPMCGGNGIPNLTNILIAMDRGYLLAGILYDFLMPSGADILGTVKRSPMFPFTFNQTLKSGDSRQYVCEIGHKALLCKNVAVQNKNLTGVAYRDGRGNVTLGLSSMIPGRQWDLVVANPNDAKRYKMPEHDQDGSVKWFIEINKVEEDSSENYDWLFSNLNVTALTLEQNTPEWFLLRMFSITSSSSDYLLFQLKKEISTSDKLLDTTTAVALNRILTLVHGAGWNQE